MRGTGNRISETDQAMNDTLMGTGTEEILNKEKLMELVYTNG